LRVQLLRLVKLGDEISVKRLHLVMAKYIKPKQDSGPTRFLYVSGIGHSLGHDPAAVESVFAKYGSLETIEFVENKRFCFIVYEHTDSAGAAYHDLNVCAHTIPELGDIKVMIRYAQEAVPTQDVPTPDCTSSTADVSVPGLQLLEDFVTVAEENDLMHGICAPSANWEQTLNRRVQVRISLVMTIGVNWF
jgi:hypothetical protein